MKYKYFEHTADVKFQAYGKNMEEAFSNAALAMFHVMYDPSKVKGKIEKEFEIKAERKRSLLYDFLEELLFLLDTEGFFLHEVVSLEIKNDSLKCVINGDDAGKYATIGDVKSITYNQMEIKEEKNKVMLQVVLDI